MKKGIVNSLWFATVLFGTGTCLFIILINIWLITEQSEVLVLHSNSKLSLSRVATTTTLTVAQSHQYLEIGKPIMSSPWTPRRWSRTPAPRSTVPTPKISDAKIYVPKLTTEHKERTTNGATNLDTAEHKEWIANGATNLDTAEHKEGIANDAANLEGAPTSEHKEMVVENLVEPRAQRTVSLGKAFSGYILAVNYYEQQTIGSKNLLQLQCVAKHLHLAVVKPVMQNSFLKTPLDEKAQASHLKFEDSFTVSDWNAYAAKASYAPLVEWEDFISDAPRDVILVRFNYPTMSVIKSRKKGALTRENGPHKAQKERFQSGCAANWPSRSELAFLEAKKFRIVRTVCFNFYYGDVLTLKEFDDHMLANYTGANITIILDAWRGLGSSQRVQIEGVCTSFYPIQEYIQPSQKLVRDAENYIQTYLKGGPFIAVMGRLEMSLLTVHTKEFSVSSCLNRTALEMLELTKRKLLPETFISIDVGKYGTKKWRSKMDKELSNGLTGFFRSVYGGKMSVREWEASFEKISSSRDAGYVALLQKVIVTRAHCILFAGGGAFQRHALNLYRQLETNRNKECLHIVKYCTSSTKLLL